MKKARLAVSFLFLLLALALNLTPGLAKPEFSKKEKKSCLVCHTAIKSKDLNPVGKCYKEKQDLKACASAQ